jgi:hypothetical protein
MTDFDFTSYHLIAEEVLKERLRQHELWGVQNWPDGTHRFADDTLILSQRAFNKHFEKLGTITWRDILHEEILEVFAEKDPAKIRAELVQVCAVAAQWISAIDRRGEG